MIKMSLALMALLTTTMAEAADCKAIQDPTARQKTIEVGPKTQH
jgi:hypothetical protein